ncbi:alpha-ketoglutarate-dependent dioxygenase AlkB family protein [Pseudahrensia aquimaris]|uniref:Alpha-ketoglutarate-dependent dioxygenase AlkB family protein n=1 Tax=Pseudahrensia aquimaris TaxID=744461 RepID=A0ABW3FHT3_9HYPH
MIELPKGVKHWPAYFDRTAQENLLQTIRDGVREAPLFTPRMPKTGKEMTVRMTNFGELGWVTDKERGYRYQDTHPQTGMPWPAMPQAFLDLWDALADHRRPPQAALINWYADDAKMGLHQDRDEADLSAPVLSISLGNECLFRVGGIKRTDKTQSFRLCSGDVMMLSDEARLAFHGVDRIYADTSDLLKAGGRINVTLRRVN